MLKKKQAKNPKNHNEEHSIADVCARVHRGDKHWHKTHKLDCTMSPCFTSCK